MNDELFVQAEPEIVKDMAEDPAPFRCKCCGRPMDEEGEDALCSFIWQVGDGQKVLEARLGGGEHG